MFAFFQNFNFPRIFFVQELLFTIGPFWEHSSQL